MNLAEETRELARRFLIEANAQDSAFLEHTDPRALQAGVLSEEAQAYRSYARKIARLYKEMRGSLVDQEIY